MLLYLLLLHRALCAVFCFYNESFLLEMPYFTFISLFTDEG